MGKGIICDVACDVTVVPVPFDSQRSLERNWPIPHAARGRDGRQEGRERGYYHLHPNLNNPFLHSSSLYYSLFTIHSRSV